MAKTIVQINYRFSLSLTEHNDICLSLADHIAAADGLLWKIWLINESEKRAGGIYLFRDQAAVQAFLTGPIVVSFGQTPGITDITVATFEPNLVPSQITRAPLERIPG
jgi:hypothetical protein